MSDTLEIASEATESFAAELAKEVGKTVLLTAASYAGAIVVLAGIGFVAQKREERKAKKELAAVSE